MKKEMHGAQRKKMMVEEFAFENFKMPVMKIMNLTGKRLSDSATNGAEIVSLYQGLPLPAQLNELEHKPVPLCADQNARRLLTSMGFSSFLPFLL
ncbi:MAG TPA: hypothetical protein VNU95_05530 [Candidatus Acidoferrales bacterium]|jgi:hypothetical protein|nr:hypothetical protein [Candidatus Acidoferrales bacterium]